MMSFITPLIYALTISIILSKGLRKNLILSLLTTATLLFAINYIYFRGYLHLYYYCNALHISLMLSIFPLMYLLIRELYMPNVFKPTELYHFLPSLIFGSISALLLYGLLNANEGKIYFEVYSKGITHANTNDVFNILRNFRIVNLIALLVQIIYYLVLVLQIPSLIRKKALDEFSNDIQINTLWFKTIVGLFSGISLLCIIFYSYNGSGKYNELFLILFFFVISCMVVFVGIISIKNIPLPYEVLLQEENTTEPQIDHKKLKVTLVKKMNDEQLYLNPNLTLVDLSKKLNTNRSYLSAIINSEFQMNFNSFVNSFRAEYIKHYMLQHPHLSCEEYAIKGGFGSVSTFKRALKRLNEECQDTIQS